MVRTKRWCSYTLVNQYSTHPPPGANALTQFIFKTEPKDYQKVLADLATARDAIIALVTEFQVVAAAYLERETAHMNDLEEARAQLEAPIADSFDVHLSNFMERCFFWLPIMILFPQLK